VKRYCNYCAKVVDTYMASYPRSQKSLGNLVEVCSSCHYNSHLRKGTNDYASGFNDGIQNRGPLGNKILVPKNATTPEDCQLNFTDDYKDGYIAGNTKRLHEIMGEENETIDSKTVDFFPDAFPISEPIVTMRKDGVPVIHSDATENPPVVKNLELISAHPPTYTWHCPDCGYKTVTEHDHPICQKCDLEMDAPDLKPEVAASVEMVPGSMKKFTIDTSEGKAILLEILPKGSVDSIEVKLEGKSVEETPDLKPETWEYGDCSNKEDEKSVPNPNIKYRPRAGEATGFGIRRPIIYEFSRNDGVTWEPVPKSAIVTPEGLIECPKPVTVSKSETKEEKTPGPVLGTKWCKNCMQTVRTFISNLRNRPELCSRCLQESTTSEPAHSQDYSTGFKNGYKYDGTLGNGLSKPDSYKRGFQDGYKKQQKEKHMKELGAWGSKHIWGKDEESVFVNVTEHEEKKKLHKSPYPVGGMWCWDCEKIVKTRTEQHPHARDNNVDFPIQVCTICDHDVATRPVNGKLDLKSTPYSIYEIGYQCEDCGWTWWDGVVENSLPICPECIRTPKETPQPKSKVPYMCERCGHRWKSKKDTPPCPECMRTLQNNQHPDANYEDRKEAAGRWVDKEEKIDPAVIKSFDDAKQMVTNIEEMSKDPEAYNDWLLGQKVACSCGCGTEFRIHEAGTIYCDTCHDGLQQFTINLEKKISNQDDRINDAETAIRDCYDKLGGLHLNTDPWSQVTLGEASNILADYKYSKRPKMPESDLVKVIANKMDEKKRAKDMDAETTKMLDEMEKKKVVDAPDTEYNCWCADCERREVVMLGDLHDKECPSCGAISWMKEGLA